jgi:hypothetical protein
MPRPGSEILDAAMSDIPVDLYQGDPSKWCTSIKAAASWCADLIPEEPRATAAPRWRNFPRVVYTQCEHFGSEFGFRGGDLFCAAFATHISMARLDGTLSWRGVLGGNPEAPDLLLHVWFRPDGEAGLFVSGTDPKPQPPEIRVDPLPQTTPWTKEGTGEWLGLKLQLPDSNNPVWEFDFQPWYARYGDWEPL